MRHLSLGAHLAVATLSVASEANNVDSFKQERIKTMNKAQCYCVIALLNMALVSPATAESIYLCRAYGGGNFWAKTHCNQHQALIERIASVPEGLPFEQQVALGEQQRSTAAALTAPHRSVVTTVTSGGSQATQQSECKALDASIQQYDAMARQPQSGQMQDWISAQRKKARDRQFQIKC